MPPKGQGRKRKDAPESSVSEKKLPKSNMSPVFDNNTQELTWTCNNEDRKYIIRYLSENVCNLQPWNNYEDWPRVTMELNNDDDEDEEHDAGNNILNHSVIGAIWTIDGEFIAVWTADEEDHIEFYCKTSYEYVDDFDELTETLCTDIAPALVDIFDDGSGISRDSILVSTMSCLGLQNYYRPEIVPDFMNVEVTGMEDTGDD